MDSGKIPGCFPITNLIRKKLRQVFWHLKMYPATSEDQELHALQEAMVKSLQCRPIQHSLRRRGLNGQELFRAVKNTREVFPKTPPLQLLNWTPKKTPPQNVKLSTEIGASLLARDWKSRHIFSLFFHYYFHLFFHIRRPESACSRIILCKIQTVPKIQNPKSKIQNPRSKIQDPKSIIQDPKTKIQSPKPKPKIQNRLDFGVWIRVAALGWLCSKCSCMDGLATQNWRSW